MIWHRPIASPSSAERELKSLENCHAFVRFGMDGTIQSANARFCEITGFDPKDIVGKDHKVLLRQKDQSSPEIEDLWKRLRKGESVNRIAPRRKSEGSELWVDVTYSPVLNTDGTLDYVVAVAREITAMHHSRRDNRSQVDAIRRSMAVIEFALDGTILTANDLFLNAVGYTLEEIKGQHHRIFVPKDEANSDAYKEFWARLGNGGSESGHVQRVKKSGELLWLEATYETLVDPEGCPFKVVKYAFDVTETKNREADVAAQLNAIQTVQAVIEFKPDGTIIRANDIFCNAMGYRSDEIIGRKHSMFVPQDYAQSDAYRKFWEDLRANRTNSDEFVRLGKGGREVYIRASYNPITDAQGRVVKIVKFAIDTTVFQVTAKAMREALSALADGRLDTRVDRDLGELDEVRQRFNEAIARIGNVMINVLERTGEIVSEARAISESTNQLSGRTERQAATLEESAAALEQLTQSVKGATELTRVAREQAGTAMTETEKSTGVVGDAIKAMDEIEESSKKISSITSVIDTIAFQTNLLALNAGVEAARAGDAGRGFAVVASEVRGLAQRSSEAAREIAGLIEESSQQVARGVDLVGRTGTSLKSIEEVVRAIRESIIQIATSSEEQSNGLGEMNLAIGELDRVTQQNAAMAEETNAAVRLLQQATVDMQKDVQYFEVGERAAEGAEDQPRVA